MSIQAQCGTCGRKYQVADALAGKNVRCKECGKGLVIPAAPPRSADEIDLGALADLEGNIAAPELRAYQKPAPAAPHLRVRAAAGSAPPSAGRSPAFPGRPTLQAPRQAPQGNPLFAWGRAVFGVIIFAMLGAFMAAALKSGDTGWLLLLLAGLGLSIGGLIWWGWAQWHEPVDMPYSARIVPILMIAHLWSNRSAKPAQAMTVSSLGAILIAVVAVHEGPAFPLYDWLPQHNHSQAHLAIQSPNLNLATLQEAMNASSRAQVERILGPGDPCEFRDVPAPKATYGVRQWLHWQNGSANAWIGFDARDEAVTSWHNM